MSRSSPPPVLIIGAGISGLILAHALSQRNVPFQVFERDASSDARSGDQGWGLTIHWALPILRELVPVDLQERFPEWLVNRGAVERAEKGSFTFFNLATGEARWQSPAKDRIRVSREKFRNGLTERLDVKVSEISLVFERLDHFCRVPEDYCCTMLMNLLDCTLTILSV